jgi:hypothetical protein
MDIRNHVFIAGGPLLVATQSLFRSRPYDFVVHYSDVLRGGFGTMPAFAADYFGSKNVGPIYGLMLTAWGSASAFGPLLIAHMRQSSGSYTSGLHVIAGIMAVSTLLPILVSAPKSDRAKVVSSTRATPAMRSN